MGLTGMKAKHDKKTAGGRILAIDVLSGLALSARMGLAKRDLLDASAESPIPATCTCQCPV